MLDRVDTRLGRETHPARAVGVGRDEEPGVVRFADRGGGLFRGVLRDLRRGAIAEDAARRDLLVSAELRNSSWATTVV